MYNYYYAIDSSYIIYYSAYSAFSEYVRDFDIMKEEQGPDFDPTLDPEYNLIFERKFRNCIERPVSKLVPFINKSHYVFCLDCPRKNIWRRDFYPEYKIQRDVKDLSQDKFNIGKAFQYAYSKIIPDYCAEFGSNILKCEYAEGDDVIAIFTKFILNLNKFNKVIIVSCDKDMVQLHNNRTHIITSEGIIRNPKSEIEKAIKCKITEDVSADDFLLFKILLGDKADNIPNIKPGVGNKKAFKLVQNKDELKKILSEDLSIARTFKRNKQLISMKSIPDTIEELIIDDIKLFLSKSDDELKNQISLEGI
jgi:5'-3' exonuclease